MIRVTPTERFNPDPDARYYRTLAEAFPCDAQQAVAFFDVSRNPRYGRWAVVVVLVILVAGSLAGCAKEVQKPYQPTSKEQRAAKRACDDGQAEWISKTEVMCLKEKS